MTLLSLCLSLCLSLFLSLSLSLSLFLSFSLIFTRARALFFLRALLCVLSLSHTL